MQYSWYLTRVSYHGYNHVGGIAKKTENYLVRADSYCGAETRIKTESETFAHGAFKVKSIKEVDISDVYQYDDHETWFLVNVRMEFVDEVSERTRKRQEHFLVTAANIKESNERVDSQLDGVRSYEIRSSKDAQITEVFWLDDEEIERKLIDADATR